MVALLAATAAGGLWALLPGLLNAYRNVNIIISGIMMNYIGTYMVSILIKSFDFLYSAASGSTVGIPEQAILPKTGLDQLLPVRGGSGANIGILIALVTGVIVYIVLNRTTFGFELCTCGANRYAATNAGINGRAIYRTGYGHCRGIGWAWRRFGLSIQHGSSFNGHRYRQWNGLFRNRGCVAGYVQSHWDRNCGIICLVPPGRGK